MKKSLSTELLRKMDAYWRAANYLSVGQIYLYDNVLLNTCNTLRSMARICQRSAIGNGVKTNEYARDDAEHCYETGR